MALESRTASPGTAPPRDPPSVSRLGVSSRGRTIRVALVATVIGLLAFLLVQGVLAAYNLGVIRDAVDRGWLGVSLPSPMTNRFPALIYGGFSYLVLALVGMAIGGRGHRVLLALPAAGYVLAGVLVGSHRTEAIGAEWGLECYSAGMTCATPWFGHPWIGPLVDLTLVVLPGWIVARGVRPRRWPGRMDAAAIAAIVTTAAIVATAGWATTVINRHTDLRVLVAVGALGLALGVTRPWWPWIHVSFALFAVGSFGVVLSYLIWPDPNYPFRDAFPYLLERSWPIVGIALIASGWQPLAWAIRKLQERPIQLVIAVNVLNIVDAVMTLLAVRSGGAFESNPVVRSAGLPAKVVLVGLLTWLLYRRKPSALVWPFVALLWVACYHVAGILVNGWR